MQGRCGFGVNCATRPQWASGSCRCCQTCYGAQATSASKVGKTRLKTMPSKNAHENTYIDPIGFIGDTSCALRTSSQLSVIHRSLITEKYVESGRPVLRKQKPSQLHHRHPMRHFQERGDRQLFEGLCAVRPAAHSSANFDALRLEKVRVMCGNITGTGVVSCDRAGKRLACCATPDYGRLALIGDTYRFAGRLALGISKFSWDRVIFLVFRLHRVRVI